MDEQIDRWIDRQIKQSCDSKYDDDDYDDNDDNYDDGDNNEDDDYSDYDGNHKDYVMIIMMKTAYKHKVRYVK